MAVQMRGQRPVPVGPADQADLAPAVLASLVVLAKLLVLLLLVRMVVDPVSANVDGKAPVARAVLFPVWAMAVPLFWATTRRASPFPWGADLLVSLTCLADLVGNRLDLYDAITWFDDWMHVMNAALASAAFVILTTRRSASVLEIREAAVAFGVTASLAWELFEYATFLTRSTEWTSAYSDTVGDLVLGWVGSVVAALLIAHWWRDRRRTRV